jgi:hypothetical protein
MGNLYYPAIFLVCATISWYCSAVGDKVLCNYRGRDYLGAADRAVDWVMFTFFSLLVGCAVTASAVKLSALWAIPLAVLAGPIVVCIIAGVYLALVHLRRTWRTLAVPNLVSGAANRICPPRDPNHFDDEHNPY